MTDDALARAMQLRNIMSRLHMLLDKEKTPRLVNTADMRDSYTQAMWDNNDKDYPKIAVCPETVEKLELLVREDFETQLRVAQEEFDAI